MKNSSLKLKILGCGTSTGVPIPGCDCRVCTSGDPFNSRLRTSALIGLPGNRNILIDASTDLRQQALRHGVRNIDAVLFTHAHADHILGIDDLRAFNFIQNASIPCYGSAGTLSAIRTVFHYIFEANEGYEGGLLPQLDLELIEEYKAFELLGQNILPFALMHGSTRVTGYRVGNLAYATDCNLIPAESEAILEGVDHLILDGLRHEPHRTHFTINQAVEASRKLGVRQTYLIHMSHSVDYHEVNRQLPEGVQLAFDGLEIEFESRA